MDTVHALKRVFDELDVFENSLALQFLIAYFKRIIFNIILCLLYIYLLHNIYHKIYNVFW